MSLLRDKSVHAAGGFLLMGVWAAYANRGFPMPAPIIAAGVQGLITMMITLFLKQVIEGIFHQTNGALRIILPTLAAFAISLTLLTLFHGLVGTPAFLATISVPLSVSTSYAFFYSLALRTHV